MDQSSFTDVLSALGMKRSPGVVYLTLLQLGPSTAYAVAERCGLKRPNVYVILDELVRLGSVRRVPHAKKKLYQARKPADVYRERVAQLGSIESAIPRLEALAPKEKRATTYYFEGQKGLRQALEYGMEDVAGTEIRGFFARAANEPSEGAEEFARYYVERLEAAGVALRGVVPQHASVRERERQATGMKLDFRTVPPKEYDSEVSVEIGPDFVRVYSLADAQAIVIANERVALALGQVFEMLWKRIGRRR